MKTIMMKKWEANLVHGGLTTTTKMPSKSYSTPTALCVTGFKMAQIEGSVCFDCYAQRNNYHRYQNGIEPAQHARYEAMLYDPAWCDAMVASIMGDLYFRWFDSGDLPSLEALERIVEVCVRTPATLHWLPTREYAMIKAYITKHGRDSLPDNLIIRLSAMYPDQFVKLPLSLQGIKNVLTSNVHTKGTVPTGSECGAPTRGGKCGPCRDCWDVTVEAVSYLKH
jgi:hypothetical protein